MATKSATIDKDHAQTLVEDFFQQFQTACVKNTPPKSADFEKYLSKNFHFTSNGQIAGDSIHDYLKRIERLQQKYSSIELSEPHQELIVAGNQVVINYDAFLKSKAGKEVQLNIMAIATIEGNKIVDWIQVANEKGSGHWDT